MTAAGQCGEAARFWGFQLEQANFRILTAAAGYANRCVAKRLLLKEFLK